MNHGDLVTLHRPGLPDVDGRLILTLASGPSVLDLRRSSRADNGYRAVTDGATIHACSIRTPCCERGEPALLIGCDEPNCEAQFFLVPARQYPTLCIDHAADRSRAEHGWLAENSVD